MIVGVAAIGAVPLVHQITDPSHRYYSRGSVLWAAVVVAAGVLAAILRSSRAVGCWQWRSCAWMHSPCSCCPSCPRRGASPSIRPQQPSCSATSVSRATSRSDPWGRITAAITRFVSSTRPIIRSPSVFATYIVTRLDPTADPYFFTGVFGPNPTQELESHLDGYRAAGVRYVLTPEGVKLPQGPKTFTLVFRSPTTWIYRLAGTEPYFTSTSPRCTVDPQSGESVRLSCSGPTTLIRRETYMPGWSAEVDGHPTTVSEYDNAFQAVTLKPGTHLVTFGFTPPYLGWALAAFFLVVPG